MLDSEILDIIGTLPHHRRWGSHHAVEVMHSLEPELTKLPLAGGGLVTEHWRKNPELLEPATQLGVLNEGFVADLISGAIKATVATTDFLINLTTLMSGP